MGKSDTSKIVKEFAACGELITSAAEVSSALETFLAAESVNPKLNIEQWQQALIESLPEKGSGLQQTLKLLCDSVIPNGLPMAMPGCSAYIMTAPTTSAMMARVAAVLISPQRFGKTAVNLLEKQALCWLVELFGLNPGMQGLFTSGGSSANLVALGAARQLAFRKRGINVAQSGQTSPGRIFVSEQTHHSNHKSAAILGLGYDAVEEVACDEEGLIDPAALEKAIVTAFELDICPIAIIANAGATTTGVIDPINALADLAEKYDIWLHVDGAYGLPSILDPRYSHQFTGLERADSVVVDPHKWLGTTIGLGAVFVKDKAWMLDAFQQADSSYLQFSQANNPDAGNALFEFGELYSELGIDLSAPARGIEVWAVLKEIGREGLAARITRHIDMALELGQRALAHPRLEVIGEPQLSICCFRYVHPDIKDLNSFNEKLHQIMTRRGVNIPSTALIDNQLVLRPCFVSARAHLAQVDSLVNEVIETGDNLLHQLRSDSNT